MMRQTKFDLWSIRLNYLQRSQCDLLAIFHDIRIIDDVFSSIRRCARLSAKNRHWREFDTTETYYGPTWIFKI